MDNNANKSIPILHIGYGKTGTTWFQNNFYPTVKNITFYSLKRIRRILMAKWRDVTISPEIKIALNQNSKRLVICDESMIGRPDYYEENANKFRELFFPAQIIIFIRNQLDKFPSNYSQYIKSGGTLNFEKYLFGPEKNFFLEKHKYDKLIDIYKDTFGVNNVHIYLFEEFSNNFKSFMNKFCSVHSLTLQKPIFAQKRTNQSLSLPMLKLMRFSNKYTNTYSFLGRTSKRIKSFLKIYQGFHLSTLIYSQLNNFLPFSKRINIESLIDNNKIELLKNYFQESNRRLIEKHGLDKIRDYHYPL